MKYFVEDKEFIKRDFSLQAMNFGQKPNNLFPLNYIFVVEVTEVMKLLKPKYEQLILEDIEDKKFWKDDDISVYHNLRKLNYPTIESIVNVNPKLFCEMILEIFSYELLDNLFEAPKIDDKNEKKFIINSLDRVDWHSVELKLSGRVYKTKWNIY